METYKFGAAAVMLDEEGRVLLVKQSYGHFNWELPGGGAESGESIVETVLREVREETGLTVAAERLTGVYHDVVADFIHFVFLCYRSNSEEQIQHDSEVLESAYWPTDALPRPISDFTVKRIQDTLSGQNQLVPETIASRRWLD